MPQTTEWLSVSANAIDGRCATDERRDAAQAPATPCRADTGRLRILLVEDNPVNQKLATRLLEQRGHEVALAGNGRQALEALEGELFDLVLMDVQMPEMDGFEATTAMRRREPAAGRRTPIVAMTAYALSGDRERCLAAGMDDYLSKPIDPQELDRVLATVRAAQPLAPEAEESVVDIPAALGDLKGNAALLAELAGLFLDQCRLTLAETGAAADRGDARAVELSAHRLKGAAAQMGAHGIARAAQALETCGCEDNLGRAAEARAALAAAVARVEATLASPALAAAAPEPSEGLG